MSEPYQPLAKPQDGEPSTVTTPAPPNYTTYVGGYQQQQQPQQPHLLNTLPEVFHRNRDVDDKEEQCDSEKKEEVRIPVDHLNVNFCGQDWGISLLYTKNSLPF